MIIPLLDLKREYSYLKQDIQKQLKSCINSQQWVLGSKVEEFEKKAAHYLGVKYAVGVASGTDALLLSLHALALKKREKIFFDKKDEIITTPFTFLATAEVIARAGANPVFVDIDPHTYNICPNQIKKAITKNTVGILPVHLYGLGADIQTIRKIAKKKNLFIVEDACQSFGGEYQPAGKQCKNKKLGTLGDLGCLSFFPSKNLGSWGDGGLVVTNNKHAAELIRVLRNHGQTKQYKADFLGFNSRLDSIQAAVLLAKIKHIDRFNKKRIQIAKRYNKAFKDIPDLSLPLAFSLEPLSLQHIYHLYTIKVDKNRDKLLKFLNSKGIAARVYYPAPLHKMKAFKQAKCKGFLKKAEAACQKVLSLPIHPFLQDREVNYVIEEVKQYFRS